MAREWNIYDKTGTTVKAVVRKLEYNGQYMADRYLSVTVQSPYPVNFEIGDIIVYRGDTFVLNYIPAVKRQARSGATGTAIVYDSIKFKSTNGELEDCQFTDYVQDDNLIHYTGLSVFDFYVSKVQDFGNRVQACLDNKYGKNVWKVQYGQDASIKKDQNFSVSAGTSVWNAMAQFNNIFKVNFTIRNRIITLGARQTTADHTFIYGKGHGLKMLTQTVNTEQKIVTKLRAYGSERNIPYRFYNEYYKRKHPELFDPELHPEMFKQGRSILESKYMPKLMLPYSVWSTHPWDAYITSENSSTYGEKDGEKFFDGSDEEWEEIYPSLVGMNASQLQGLDGFYGTVSYGNSGALDRVVEGSTIQDNGVSDDGTYEDGSHDTDGVAITTSFKITIPNVGFNIWDQRINGETPYIEMTSGMCMSDHGKFEILSVKQKDPQWVSAGYELTLQRVYDSAINMYYPNRTFQVQAGDYSILSGISMPDVYVEAAEQRLLAAAQQWLSENDHEKYTYQPEIDNIFMAEHPDLSDSLTEGMKLMFSDTELGIQEAAVTISQLVIKEGEGGDNDYCIPQYEIQLNDDVEATLMEKVEVKIHEANADFTASFESIARQLKDKLSKVVDDVAQGKITFAKGLLSQAIAEFGTYARNVAGVDDNGAAILTNGLGDFMNLKVIQKVLGNLTIEQRMTATDIIFTSILKSLGGSPDMNGTGIYMDAETGVIATDGLDVRGWMRVAKLIYNMIQVMEQDYLFSGGGDIEDVVDNGDGTYTLKIHKEKEGRHTSFGEYDILYGKVDDLQESGGSYMYYTSWMRVVEGGVTLNDGMEPDEVTVQLWEDNMVPGNQNFAPQPMMTVAKRGNTTDRDRQGLWELSTTDKRITYYWNVDQPKLRADNYALCLGILPTILDDAGILPSTRDKKMPSLYVNTIFYEHQHHIYYPCAVVKVDRGIWNDSPTATYNGVGGEYEHDGTLSDANLTIEVTAGRMTEKQANELKHVRTWEGTYVQGDTISDPYHFESFSKAMWLTERLSPANASLSDLDLWKKMLKEWKDDLETSRVYNYGILWECLDDETDEEPAFDCDNWTPISGNVVKMDLQLSLGDFMDIGEENELTCTVYYGEEDVTDKVDDWTIERDSGDAAEDAVWNATQRAQAFDGTFTLRYTNNASTNDLGDEVPTIFIIKAKKNNTVIAQAQVEV